MGLVKNVWHDIYFLILFASTCRLILKHVLFWSRTWPSGPRSLALHPWVHMCTNALHAIAINHVFEHCSVLAHNIFLCLCMGWLVASGRLWAWSRIRWPIIQTSTIHMDRHNSAGLCPRTAQDWHVLARGPRVCGPHAMYAQFCIAK